MSTPMTVKLSKNVSRAISLNENTGHARFSFIISGEKFYYTGTVNKRGYFIPTFPTKTDEKLFNAYVKMKEKELI